MPPDFLNVGAGLRLEKDSWSREHIRKKTGYEYQYGYQNVEESRAEDETEGYLRIWRLECGFNIGRKWQRIGHLRLGKVNIKVKAWRIRSQEKMSGLGERREEQQQKMKNRSKRFGARVTYWRRLKHGRK